MQAHHGPVRRMQHSSDGAFQPVDIAVLCPVSQRGQRTAPLLMRNDQVNAGTDMVTWQADLDQHGRDVRAVEAADCLVKVACERLGRSADLGQHVREFGWIGTCKSALDPVPAGQRQGILELHVSGRMYYSPPHSVDEQRERGVLLDLRVAPRRPAWAPRMTGTRPYKSHCRTQPYQSCDCQPRQKVRP